MGDVVRFPLLRGFLSAILLVGALKSISAGENYAFLVGVGDYDRTELKPLRFTRADIQEFGKSLSAAGYAERNIVVMHDDPNKPPKSRYLPLTANIREELNLLVETLEKEDSLIVAFAGHGVQFEGEKDSFFCPHDAKLSKRDTLIGFADVLKQMETCKASRKLLLVDACRNEPQSDIARSRAEVNLESVTRPQTVEVPKTLLALFSCGPGQQSFEDPDLGHGIFFHHVLKGWGGEADRDKDGSLEFGELESYVRRETKEYARLSLKAVQTPQFKGELSEEWILRSINGAAPPKTKVNSLGATLIRIEPGEYLRGSTLSEIERIAKEDLTARKEYFTNEMPQHRVRITKPFFLGKTEVTQTEWQAVMVNNPCRFCKTGKGSGTERVRGMNTSKFPVESVSWFDAIEFCNRLSLKEGLTAYYQLEDIERYDGSMKNATVSLIGGRGYRLPTEAEWEYACRAGTTTRFSFGDASNGTESNILGEFPLGTRVKGEALNRPSNVGSYPDNAFGLVDMHGNVWEWCQDRFDENSYADYAGKTAVDPVVTASASTPKDRILRGGSWYYYAWYSRSALRDRSLPDARSHNVGFRVARNP